VAYLAQHPVMLEGTVRDNLDAGFATGTADLAADKMGQERQQEARRLLGALLIEPDEVLGQEARTLSGGEAARIALVRALLIQPAVLLADEPTASLDPDGASALVKVLTGWIGRGGALVLVAHDSAPWEGLKREVLELGSSSSAST
jgi:putative ABC transport system ATP-binding protein